MIALNRSSQPVRQTMDKRLETGPGVVCSTQVLDSRTALDMSQGAMGHQISPGSFVGQGMAQVQVVSEAGHGGRYSTHKLPTVDSGINNSMTVLAALVRQLRKKGLVHRRAGEIARIRTARHTLKRRRADTQQSRGARQRNEKTNIQIEGLRRGRNRLNDFAGHAPGQHDHGWGEVVLVDGGLDHFGDLPAPVP
ncbi:hypothetical protein NUU61_008538 [Penicillium alfredii]|uniref:Uncharacterized protein n=1 Tax=Penicillium alfredii TaxID=1506179 RepID=A0A9W9ELK7_9EURO|nr:uncharacterized protein NUU61_008538 [Penicillium alfredii]KAJ5083959.1 hypothetical protein NUU61_008538 [Penicillium alfredii]